MTRTFAAVLLTLGLSTQGGSAPMPPPGNPNHEKPAAGAFCRNYANDGPEHRCECVRICELQPDGTMRVVEDQARCRAWCFKDACRCLSDSCDGHHHH